MSIVRVEDNGGSFNILEEDGVSGSASMAPRRA